MSYPYWNPPRVVATTVVSVGWGNDVQNALKSLLQDVHDAKGTVTTLKAFIGVTVSTDGTMKSGAVKHSNLYNVLASQHNAKIHATTHLNAVDNVPIATITAYGLVDTTMAVKLNSIQSNATYNIFTASHYFGSGITASQYISLGYRPKWVYVSRKASDAWTEIIDGMTFSFNHVGVTHSRTKASLYLRIAATGFYTASTLNTAATHFYTAVRGT